MNHSWKSRWWVKVLFGTCLISTAACGGNQLAHSGVVTSIEPSEVYLGTTTRIVIKGHGLPFEGDASIHPSDNAGIAVLNRSADLTIVKLRVDANATPGKRWIFLTSIDNIVGTEIEIKAPG